MKNQELANEILLEFWNSRKDFINFIFNDFNKGELGVLNFLEFEKNKVTAGELSEAFKVSTARIASILRTLEVKKYIVRKVDEIDKRKTIVEITDMGQTFVLKMKDDILKRLDLVIEKIGEKEIKDYLRLTLKINKLMNDTFTNEIL